MEMGAQDSTMFSNCERAFLGLPAFIADAAMCLAFAGAGYGVAYVAEFDRPELAAAAAGGGCVVLKLLD